MKPIWFDSLGAKSSAVLVETDKKILIDPGASAMHPNFPAPKIKKLYWRERARAEIRKYAKIANIVIISHYHYDHYRDFEGEIYRNKIIFAKNPNEYINDSQRKRAERFYGNICRKFANEELENFLEKPKKRRYKDPLNDLEIAISKDFGEYNKRRRELLERGKEWFDKKIKRWQNYGVIPELKFKNVCVRFADGKKFRVGKTKLRFTKPLFHGVEFSKVGWVFATVVEYKGQKLIHSSDLNGPIIEDYAEWIINENPDILILDGPPTYLIGYMLNLINFKRALENAKRIVKGIDAELIIYDHHLPREPKFRERTKEVWELAKKLGKKVLTGAEYFGRKPIILNLT